MDLRHTDLNLIRAFAAIYRHKNVTQAALSLAITQPALSLALSRLKKIYGDPLFIYAQKTMQPTALVHRIYPAIAQALELIKTSLACTAVFEPQTSRRVFHIAMTDWLQMVILPPLLKRINQQAPQISISIHHKTIRDMNAALESREIDVAISGMKYENPGKFRQKLFHEKYLCIVSKKHPRIHGKMSLADFVAFPHILFAPQGRGPGVVDHLLKQRRLKRHIVLRVPQSVLIPHLISQTDFIATIPRPIALFYEKLLPIRALPPPLDIPGHDIVQYWHKLQHEDVENQWLRRVLHEITREKIA